jgi:hypothetical protein
MNFSTSQYRKLRCDANIAADRLIAIGRWIQAEFKYNPHWHLQPRVPGGQPDGGQWTDYLQSNIVGPLVRYLAPEVVRRLREHARRLAPILRRMPRRWDDSRQPTEESYDDESGRISQDSWQRRGEPNIRFRSESELRRYLGPAGEGREWHHIVEKRLAGREGFPAELIHSTDNIISLPIEVHRRVSARMSTREEAYGKNIRRFEVEKRTFGEQYDDGLALIEETLEEFGYDPKDF